MTSGIKSVADLVTMPPRRAANRLIRLFYSQDERLRWGAIDAFGEVVGALAHEDPEAARIFMRRLMWSLNDESGGIGWGAPEAMASVMVNSREMATEYGPILVSYVKEDGNFLEYPPLRVGAMWGLAITSRQHPDIMSDVGLCDALNPYLSQGDLLEMVLAIIAVKAAGCPRAGDITVPEELKGRVVRLYWDGRVREDSLEKLLELGVAG